MLKRHKTLLLHLGLIFLVSLLPFFWLRNGQAILGHDAGFPLSPWVHFLDRIFVWSHRFGLGNDQTTEIGGFFIHGFEGVVSWLGFPLTQVQQITFSAYFLGFGVSMYVLARELFPERKKYLPLVASFIYMINHFILQAWFIVERTKFTLYIAFPLAIALMVKVSRGKISPLTGAALGSLLMFVFNGGGFFPLFGSMLVSVPYFFLILILASDEKLKTLTKLVSFILMWTVGTMVLSAFWLLPYFRFLVTSFAQELSTAGGQSGVLAWVQTISENASFYNLMRLQGIPEWYANPLHPYAMVYLENIWFILFSHLLPFLAFFPLIVAKKMEKKFILIIVGLVLLGMFFIAGSHPPFGFLYVWLIQNIPGFVVFRTPYYKFAPILWLGYSLLIAYSVDYLSQKLKKRKNLPLGLVAAFLVIWGGYHYPFFKGNFFEYEVGQKTTKVSVPEYVFEYAEWANSPEFPYQRLLLLPGQNPDTRFEAYNWGYWSLAQLQGLLNNRSYIGNSLYKATTEEIFIKNIFQLVENQDPSWVDQASYLFVDAVLLRKDFDYQLKNSETIDPNILEEFLDNDPRFTKVKQFGEWIVYELENEPKSFAFKDYFYEIHAQSKEKFFEPSSLPGLDIAEDTVFLEESNSDLRSRRKGIIYIPECVHCQLDDRRIFEVSRNQIVTAGSVFYPWQEAADQKRLDSAQTPQQKLQVSSELSLKRLFQLENQFGRKAPIEDRIKGWESYLAVLTEQETALKSYIKSLPQYSFNDNKYLAGIYENLAQAAEELQIGLEEVSQKEEVALFVGTQEKLESLQEIVSDYLWYTSDTISKKYLLEADEAGSYDLYVKTNTTNAFSVEGARTAEIGVINNLKSFPVSIENGNDQWSKISTISLEEGVNRFEFKEPSTRVDLTNNEPLILDFAEGQKCQTIPLYQFKRGSYFFNMEIYSERDLDDFYLFIDKENGTLTPLPYWGRKLIIDGQKTTYLDFKESFLNQDDYVARFCRITTAQLKPHTVTFENIYFEKISEPLIALVKTNDEPLPPPNNLSISSKRNNQTDYELSLSGSGESLLMFDQRFDSGWVFDKPELFSNHQSVHGYANGWLIKKDNEDTIDVSLTYVGQRLHEYGWYISIAGLSGIVLILIWQVKKKSK